MSDVNVAEEAAKANAVNTSEKTTVEEMLQDYRIETVRLQSGRVFDIESFIPESLMLNLSSPLIKEFVEEERQKGEELYRTRVPSVATNFIVQLVASHIISMSVSMQPQSQCPEGVVSIDRFTLDEIRELFKAMCVLSGVPLSD